MTDEDTPGGAPGGAGVTPRPNTKLGPQLIAVSPKRWSPAAEERFLDELATSANVERAAIAAGFSTHGIYARRRKDASFAERWQAARLAARFPELEAQLCGMIEDGSYAGPGRSPDRADAMVWALTELMLAVERVRPRIRVL